MSASLRPCEADLHHIKCVSGTLTIGDSCKRGQKAANKKMTTAVNAPYQRASITLTPSMFGEKKSRQQWLPLSCKTNGDQKCGHAFELREHTSEECEAVNMGI